MGFVAMAAGVIWLLVRPGVSPDVVAPVLMLLAAAPIVLLELGVHRVHRRASTGLDWSSPRPIDWGRVATRWLGAAGAVGLVLGIYSLAPEYQGSFYDAYYRFLWTFGPPAAVAGLIYLALLDRVLVQPEDKHWHLGCLLTGRPFSPDAVLDLLRGWIIKGYFVPLMYIYMIDNVVDLRKIVSTRDDPFLLWFDSLWSAGFLVDVVFTTMGYLLSARIVDTHLRSTEPTAGGWVVAIICYQPFFSLISGQYLTYNNGLYWGPWLDGLPLFGLPVLKWLWGGVLLLTLVVFSGSTVTFGCRFSNLTHRGILTNGPYRYTKHPAYWSKIISFWMIFVPFVYHGSVYELVRDCVWLSVLSLIYFLRARTEEAHLSRDPDYVRYALWINEHGVFAFLGRWWPALAYRPPRDPAEPPGD